MNAWLTSRCEKPQSRSHSPLIRHIISAPGSRRLTEDDIATSICLGGRSVCGTMSSCGLETTFVFAAVAVSAAGEESESTSIGSTGLTGEAGEASAGESAADESCDLFSPTTTAALAVARGEPAESDLLSDATSSGDFGAVSGTAAEECAAV